MSFRPCATSAEKKRLERVKSQIKEDEGCARVIQQAAFCRATLDGFILEPSGTMSSRE